MKDYPELAYEADHAFYIWETTMYGEKSPLSDADRELWIAGFLRGYRVLEAEVKHK